MSAVVDAEGLRERGKRRRVEQILQATRELLRENEERTPNVAEIADRAEVAPATIFNLIGTRERVWAALVNEALDEITARLSTDSSLDPRERARQVVAQTSAAILADAPVYRAVLSHWRDIGRLLRADPSRELLACLESARDSGTIRDDVDLELNATLIATGCTGAVHQWAARLIDDQTLTRRCVAFVDLAFDAASAS